MSKLIRLILIFHFFLYFNFSCDVLVNPTADIVVFQASTKMENISGIYDYGRVEVNETASTIFRIMNVGNTDLKLTGTPAIEIKGTDSANFTLVSQPSTIIAKSHATTFSIKFAPVVSKFYEAEVSIVSNDEDKTPYTFILKGRGVVTDINVRQGNTYIPAYTGVFDFGNIYYTNPSVTLTFTIENVGSKTLNIVGASPGSSPAPIELKNHDFLSFKLNQDNLQDVLQPGESTTFTIRFEPNSAGEKSALVSIPNDDKDENPYEFIIKGKLIDPEIEVLDSAKNLIECNVGEFHFPDNFQNNVMSETFTIKNIGTTALLLSDSPIIQLSGVTSHAFSVVKQPDASVSAGSQTTFTIEFNPSDEKQYSATVTIANNDEDENPFVFTIYGYGYIPHFDFNGDGYDDVIISAPQEDLDNGHQGCPYIVLGRKDSPGTIRAHNTDLQIVIKGAKRWIGRSISVAGDINDDGFDDVIIGAAGIDGEESNYAVAKAFIVFGRRDLSAGLNILSEDVEIRGNSKYDRLGDSVANAGDFNGDGIDDIIIGAPGCDDAAENSGCAFIFFGRSNWASRLTASSADVKIMGENWKDYLGHEVSSAGDFNNDGYDDVLMSVSVYSETGYSTDRVIMFFGSQNPPRLTSASDANVNFDRGPSYDSYFGWDISSAGDFNNDGFDDIIIGVSDVFLFCGSSNPPKQLFTSDADVYFDTRVNGKHVSFVNSPTGIGDFNNDGFDDIAFSFRYDGAGVFIFFGSSNFLNNLSYEDADIKIIRPFEDSALGRSICSAGDFNNDRCTDLIVGDPYGEYNNTHTGCAYIFLGKSQTTTPMFTSDAFLQITGFRLLDEFGRFVSGGK